MTATAQSPQRLDGLDLARFAALVGMIFVNFNVVMTPHCNDLTAGSSASEFDFAVILQGRAAATFVVLAGVGLGLSAKATSWRATFSVTLKRVAFLLAVGLLNMLVFDADIIHYYAFYFLFGVVFLKSASWLLWSTIAGLILAQLALVLTLDYEAGWDWQTYAYRDFWTSTGFLRNLFFNGWHPVIPWLAFLLFGLLMSRWLLNEKSTQRRMLWGGVLVYTATMILSKVLIGLSDRDVAILFGTDPLPPMPLYVVAGASVASAVSGLCLILGEKFASSPLLAPLTATGKQTLTLYIAHILIGMGILEEFGMLGTQSAAKANVASIIFCIAAILFATIWSRHFTRGPLESVMRRVAG